MNVPKGVHNRQNHGCLERGHSSLQFWKHPAAPTDFLRQPHLNNPITNVRPKAAMFETSEAPPSSGNLPYLSQKNNVKEKNSTGSKANASNIHHGLTRQLSMLFTVRRIPSIPFVKEMRRTAVSEGPNWAMRLKLKGGR